MMCRGLEHPEITWIERTGYPSWMQEGDDPEIDEDSLYEEKRERELLEKE
jgi:hypothetical protein